METVVVHCMEQPFDVYIGRKHPRFPAGSKWQNPFKIGKDGTREQVLEKFRLWLPKQKHLIANLEELRGKTLGCWCKSASDPKPCHGDIYLEFLQKTPQQPNSRPANPDRPMRRAKSFHKKKLIKMPAGSTPQGLLKFVEGFGVKVMIRDNEIVCRIPDTLNPTPINEVMKSKKNFMLAAIGGCEACKACGRVNENRFVCAYEAFFLGKAAGPKPIDVARKKCPLDSLVVL